MDINIEITDAPNAMEKITLYQILIWIEDKEIKMQEKMRMKKRKKVMADKEKMTKEKRDIKIEKVTDKEIEIFEKCKNKEIRFLCTVNNFCFFERPMCIAGHL